MHSRKYRIVYQIEAYGGVMRFDDDATLAWARRMGFQIVEVVEPVETEDTCQS